MGVTAREPIRLLTISREFGAGGSDLGLLLGRRLGWRVLDQQFATELAGRVHCAECDAAALDEHAPSFFERLIGSFTVTAPEAAQIPPPLSPPDPDQLVAASRDVLTEAVQQLPLIVIGHGANVLFRGRPDLLRVRVSAPFDVRVERVARRAGLPLHDASQQVRYRDSDRAHYLQRYYHVDVHDPYQYDLHLNTGTFPLETAADLVVATITASERSAAVAP